MRKMYLYCPCCCSLKSLKELFGKENYFLEYQCLDYDSIDMKFLKRLGFLLDDEELYSLNIIGVNDCLGGLNKLDELIIRNELMKLVYEFSEAPFIKDLYDKENLNIYVVLYNAEQGTYKVI